MFPTACWKCVQWDSQLLSMGGNSEGPRPPVLTLRYLWWAYSGPEVVHILMSRSVTTSGNTVSETWVCVWNKVATQPLQDGDDPGTSGWTKCSHRVLTWDTEAESRLSDVTGRRSALRRSLEMEEGPLAREEAFRQRLEKAGTHRLPWPPKEHGSANTLTLGG